MTVDLEAGGALATAALAAKAIEGDGGPVRGEHPVACANCKTTLVGAYCHACGQTAHVHRSIWHMFEEALHGVLHFDSKSWRTLPLLIARPGLLTRRYIDGQRVRYVSPLALFLFTVFLMFFVFSFVASNGKASGQVDAGSKVEGRASLVAEIDAARQQVADAQAAVAVAKTEQERADASTELVAAREELRVLEAALRAVDKATSKPAPGSTVTFTAEELQAITGDAVPVGVATALKDVAKNPELMFYKFKNTAYKFSFVLIPISLPFLWLMFFWRKGVTAYDHLVFSMYSLSFMSLLFVLIGLLSVNELTARVIPVLLWVPPFHMFFHLRETYGLKLFSALWRTIALLVSAGTVFVLFMILVAAISFS